MRIPWRECLPMFVMIVLISAGCSRLSDESEAPSITAESAAATPTEDSHRLPTLPPSPTPLADLENTVLNSVAEAEAEARTWPVIEAASDPTDAAGKYAGRDERVCVEVQPGVSESGAWRSGDFVAGHFDVFFEQRPTKPRYGKLWWSPTHNRPDLLAGVSVRAVRLDGSDPPTPMKVFFFDGVAWPSSPESTPTPLPEGGYPDYFYPSTLSLPMAGKWMLVATMGPNWGCYVIELEEEE